MAQGHNSKNSFVLEAHESGPLFSDNIRNQYVCTILSKYWNVLNIYIYLQKISKFNLQGVLQYK